MAYALFILLNATLFLRPAELLPGLGAVPVYECLIVSGLALALPAVLRQFSIRSLRESPVTSCVLGLLVAVVLSHLAHLFLWGARESGMMFLKLVLYYLLLVGVIDSERRLRNFLVWMALFISFAAVLPLLAQNGIVDVAALEALEQREINLDTGEVVSFPRLRGSGIFHDPNDFAMILVAGVVLSFHFLGDRTFGLSRPLWLLPLAACGYAFWLTRSRGGILAFLAAAFVLAHARWGWRRAVLAGLAVVPVALAGFATRAEAMESGTGQARVQLWSDGFSLFVRQPLFGIGQGLYVEEVGQVAHNSFLHCYAELGLLGGTLFLGAFVAAVWRLYQTRPTGSPAAHPEVRRLVAAVSAVLVGSAVSQMSLSRPYVVPTYMLLGLATAAINVAPARPGRPLIRTDFRFAAKLSTASVAFLIVMYVYVRSAVQFS